MRVGVQVYANVFLQLDNMGANESSEYGGAAPFFRYNAYILGTHVIRQGDLLVDLFNIDPKTSVATQYRIIDDPESFPDGHIEISCERMRGV
jgi:hypothetical protein